MKIEEIVMLTKAGYTKADIEKLLTVDPQPVPTVEEIQEVVPEQKPVEEQPVQKPDDDRMTKLETKLDYVVNRLNYMAVKDSKQPEQAAETVDDILAKMIR